MNPDIQLNSVVVAFGKRASTTILGETVQLQLKIGKRRGFDRARTGNWARLKKTTVVSRRVNIAVDRFDVDRARRETDATQLTRALMEAGFVETSS